MRHEVTDSSLTVRVERLAPLPAGWSTGAALGDELGLPAPSRSRAAEGGRMGIATVVSAPSPDVRQVAPALPAAATPVLMVATSCCSL